MVFKKKKKIEEEEEEEEEETEEETIEVPKPPKEKKDLWEVKLVQSLTDPFVNVEAVLNTETEEVIYSKNPYADAHIFNELEKVKKAIV